MKSFKHEHLFYLLLYMSSQYTVKPVLTDTSVKRTPPTTDILSQSLHILLYRGEWGTLGHGVHWDKGSTVCLFIDDLTVSHVS